MDANQKPKAAKKAATSKPAAARTVKSAKKSTPAAPHIDHIARAAYLNYRKRVEQGLPGDCQSDWLLAEQQLNKANTALS